VLKREGGEGKECIVGEVGNRVLLRSRHGKKAKSRS